MNAEYRYTKIGGWLLFFWVQQIVVLVFGCGAVFSQVVSLFTQSVSLLAVVYFLRNIAEMVAVFAMVRGIYCRKPYFFPLYCLYSAYTIVYTGLVELFTGTLASLTGAINAFFQLPAWYLQFVLFIAFAFTIGTKLVWAFYFVRSRRVYVYMGGDAYIQKRRFFTKLKAPAFKPMLVKPSEYAAQGFAPPLQPVLHIVPYTPAYYAPPVVWAAYSNWHGPAVPPAYRNL